jgi:uncharacterized secreted protein with C-terminal beta-propeller domain
MTDDLRRRLESLADRGEPRGATAVLAAARRQVAAAAAQPRPLFAAAALAAAVLALLGTTAVVVHDDGGQQPAESAAAANSSTSTTAVPDRRLTTVERASRLRRYSSCESLVATTRRKAMEMAGPYGLPGYSGPASGEGLVAGDSASAGTATGSAAASSPSKGAEAVEVMPSDMTAGGSEPVAGGMGDGGPFSETNVQEPGVDEPDRVKTDGHRLLTIHDERLWYATVTGGAARIEGDISLPGASELLLVGDRAVVFGYRRDRIGATETVVSVVDVRSPRMGVVASLVVQGNYVSARAVDGVTRIVLRSEPAHVEWHYPEGGTDAARTQAAARNRELVARSAADVWLPSLVIEDGIGQVRATRSLVDCDATYHPQTFAGFGTLSVLTVDPTDPDAATSASVQADGDRVYASRDRLYVATNGWQHLDGDRQVVPEAFTLVHAFDISGRAPARYTVSGRVAGVTIGQFAFSEHEGFLRVASTTTSASDSESRVTVLRDNGAVLEEVGRVDGLGPDEQIQAVRFLGPAGYVVTFRRTDPLYVVDLSDPRKPRVAGELKIPGYSAYLHPIGPGLLLGVGQDADEEGRTRGSQVSVFDVSDPAKPTRLHQLQLNDGGSSIVEFDHHAFLWWAPTGLAVIPLQKYYWWTSEQRPFTGVVGLAVGREGVREVGRVRHPEEASVQARMGSHIERSVVVGSTLFTVSQLGILAADLHTLVPGTWTPYPAS